MAGMKPKAAKFAASPTPTASEVKRWWGGQERERGDGEVRREGKSWWRGQERERVSGEVMRGKEVGRGKELVGRS